jgi:two-component system chemotaxis response regulator CheB
MEAPMVIAQHMPERFTLALADTLTARTGRRVFEVAHGQLIGPGDVAIAPGGRNLTLLPRGSGRFVAQVRTGPDTIYKPSVDLLFTSAATVARAPVGVALTGMGDDGARGARVLTDRGAAVFAQEPSTCLIDGMPKSAIKIGGAMGMTIEEMGEKFATMWRTSRESIRANGERS